MGGGAVDCHHGHHFHDEWLMVRSMLEFHCSTSLIKKSRWQEGHLAENPWLHLISSFTAWAPVKSVFSNEYNNIYIYNIIKQ